MIAQGGYDRSVQVLKAHVLSRPLCEVLQHQGEIAGNVYCNQDELYSVIEQIRTLFLVGIEFVFFHYCQLFNSLNGIFIHLVYHFTEDET